MSNTRTTPVIPFPATSLSNNLPGLHQFISPSGDYFVRSIDPDGTLHGVLGAPQHGYFESSPNHDVHDRLSHCAGPESVPLPRTVFVLGLVVPISVSVLGLVVSICIFVLGLVLSNYLCTEPSLSISVCCTGP